MGRIVIPVSSKNSLQTALSNGSPTSTFPPGISQVYERQWVLTNKTSFFSFITKAETEMPCFGTSYSIQYPLQYNMIFHSKTQKKSINSFKFLNSVRPFCSSTLIFIGL